MGEILDFEQRRKNFMDEYDQRANINNHIRANGTNEEVSIPEFVRTKRPLTKEEQQIAIAQKRFDKALNTLSRREQEKLLKKLREEKRIIGKEEAEREYNKDKIPERLIPKQVEEYIATIANTQANNNNVRNGEFDKDKVIKRYQKTLETTSEFAAGNLTIEFKEQDGEKTKEVKDMEFDQITQKEYQEMQNAKNSQDKSTDEER